MKRLALASVLVSIGVFGACAVEEPVSNDPGPVAGTGQVAGASATNGGAGGAGAQGGTAGGLTGGTSGTSGAGLTGGMGGDINTSGTSGASGTGGTSGASGTGGDGGSMFGGTSGASGTGGTSGASGTGGTAGTTGGTAGTAGTAGTGGAPCPTTAQLFPVASVTGQATGLTGNPNPAGAMGSLDGYLIMTPCTDTNCDDCSGGGSIYNGTTTGCSGSLNAVQNFTVGGTPGTRYRATLHFYGIVEPKNYGNAATRGSTMRPNNSDTGATPVPWAYATGNPTYTASDYNTYEVHVVDNNGMEVCSHFLNSDTSEGHWTYVLNYAKTIDVIGGGRVRVRVYDRNCRMIKNCYAGGSQGACSGTGCNNKARTLTVPNAPAALMQPGLGNDTNQAGQWLHIKVEQVQCGMTNLTCAGM